MTLLWHISLSMEISRLTRDWTAEPVSRDQISGANGDREIFTFPVQLTTNRIVNLTQLILTLAMCDNHTYIHDDRPGFRGYLQFNKYTYIHTYIR